MTDEAPAPPKKKRRRKIGAKPSSPPPHPLWGIVLLGMILTWVTVSLYLNAAKFDSTEGKAIATIAGPLLLGWCWWFYKWKQNG